MKYEWVVIGDVLGVQVFATNSRFHLVDLSFGEFCSLCPYVWGKRRDYFKTMASPFFLLWDMETLSPVSATLGALAVCQSTGPWL